MFFLFWKIHNNMMPQSENIYFINNVCEFIGFDLGFFVKLSLYNMIAYTQVQMRKFHLRKILIIFLPIILNMCFGCSKKMSH